MPRPPAGSAVIALLGPFTGLVLALGLVCCGPSEDADAGSGDGAATDSEGDEPTQPVDDGPAEVDPPEPTWSTEELAEAVEEALLHGLPDPFSPRDLYVGMFDHADGDCPTSELPYHLPGDYQGCTTADGTTFFGHGEYQEGVQEGAMESFYLLGDFYILDAEGERFDGAGEALYSVEQGTGEADVLFNLLLSGTWSYTGAEGWMGRRTSLALWSYGVWAGDRAIGTLEGSVTVGSAEQDDVFLYFEDLAFDPQQCEERPIRGELRVRDPSGYWVSLPFDDACSGCATAIWTDGSELGEICLDFQGATDALFSRLATADGLVSP